MMERLKRILSVLMLLPLVLVVGCGSMVEVKIVTKAAMPTPPTAGSELAVVASPTSTSTPVPATPTPTNTPTTTPTPTNTPTGTPVCAVVIQEPVYEVDTVVTVRGDPGDTIVLRDMNALGVIIGTGTVGPGEYCNSTVAIDVNGNLVNGHIIAAISSLHPPTDTACVGVTACWATKTPTPTGTPYATATPVPATATSIPTVDVAAVAAEVRAALQAEATATAAAVTLTPSTALTIYLRDTNTETGYEALSADQPNGGMIYQEGRFVYGDAAVPIGDTVSHFDEPEEPGQLPDPWRVEFEFAEELVARTQGEPGFDAKKAWFWVGTLDGDSAVGEENPYSLTIQLYEGNELRESLQVFFTVADVSGPGGEGGPGKGPPP